MSERATPTEVLPLLPLRGAVMFPGAATRLSVGRRRSLAALDQAAAADGRIVLVAQKRADVDEPAAEDVYPVGVISDVRSAPDPEADGARIVVASGASRCRILEWTQTEPYIAARVEPFPDLPGTVTKALAGEVRKLFLSGPHQQERLLLLSILRDSTALDFIIASQIELPFENAQEILEEPGAENRYRMLLPVLQVENRIARVGSDIWKQALAEEGGGRERYLRDRKAEIEHELTELTGEGTAVRELRERVEKGDLPDEARAEADRELARMDRMAPGQPEYDVAEDYLDWLLSLPWHESTEGDVDLPRAREVLDRDHYDRAEVKERVLEYLSVRRLREGRQGALLCFVGPPGVGKTSMGRSIAEATGRRFYRIALGGIRDEAEIRGHRRTYLGAQPGCIIRSLRRIGARNPVIMLDEVDKLGAGPMGDPSGALLEVLDPDQNSTFVDNYLGVAFDLSDILFIGTANTSDTIPGPLLDRLEVIELPGYTTEEKAAIAVSHLVPRQVEATGLDPAAVEFDAGAIDLLVERYTREAGVRSLERQIASICRKLIRRGEGKSRCPARVDRRRVEALLGPPPYFPEPLDRSGRPGVCATFAIGGAGAQLLLVEVARVEGTGRLTVTGRVGQVLGESASLAFSYWKARAERFGLEAGSLAGHDFHVHFPGGATPKEGVSAGLALALAFGSLLSEKVPPAELAALGEITLHGRVLPIDRLGERLAAAERAGISRVLLPERNRTDIEAGQDRALPEGLQIEFVSSVEEALRAALDMVPLVQTSPP